MKSTRWRTLAAIALMAFAVTAITGYAQDYITTVSDSAFTDHSRSPVPFFHDEHNEKAGIETCNGCHHVYVEGKRDEYDSSEGMECSECHFLGKNDDPMPLIRVYHLQCKGCHLEQQAGPILCGECHREPEASD